MPTRTPITDPDDPRAAPYRNVRDADLAGREHAFIVEGRLNVQTLLSPAARYPARSVLGTSVALDAIAHALDDCAHPIDVYEAAQPVMDTIVGFHIHRGLLALATRTPVPAAADLLATPDPPRVVVCVEDLTNHDNMGGLFRNAAAFGAGALLTTPRCCDPLYRKAIRVSMGHALTTPHATIPPAAEGVRVLDRLGYASLALTPAAGVTITEAAEQLGGNGRVAVWVGHEGHGLSRGVIGSAAHAARIPMAAGVDSLNTATALAVALHTLASV